MSTQRAPDCLFGDTSTTKTSRLGDAAEYYFEKTGLPSRLVCTDNAGWGPLESLVDRGIIQPYKVTSERKFLIQDLSRLSQGGWPKDPEDPLSEIVRCDLSKIAAYLYDGITTTCQLMMEVHQSSITVTGGVMSATHVKVPEMPKDSYVESGDYSRRFVGRSDYMGVQDRIAEFIRNTSMLPIPAIWTALESKGEDDQKKPIYGPQFIGRALTGVCGPWFGNLIHLDFINKLVDVADPDNPAVKFQIEQPTPYMFLKPHFDPKDPLKIKYPAKVRAPRTLHEKVPAFCKPRLDLLYKFLDSLREEERAAAKDAPNAR